VGRKFLHLFEAFEKERPRNESFQMEEEELDANHDFSLNAWDRGFEVVPLIQKKEKKPRFQCTLGLNLLVMAILLSVITTCVIW
jgi:hypothetical protein